MNPILDRPDVLRVLFHPRKDHGYPFSTTSARLISVEVDPEVRIGGRLYPADINSPLIIFSMGTGRSQGTTTALLNFTIKLELRC